MSAAGAGDGPVAALRAALEGSRHALLEALQELAEPDFEADLDGQTVSGVLAALAPAEREAVRRARAAAGLAARPTPAVRARQRVLPPQIVHDLAGARFETRLLLGELVRLDGSKLALPAGAVAAETVRGLLEAVAERERAAASRLRERRDPSAGN